MQRQIRKRRRMFGAVLIVSALFAAAFLFFLSENAIRPPQLLAQIALPVDIPEEVPRDDESDVRPTVVALPTRLRIPDISVDAPVVYVGLTPDGAMDVPKRPEETAWFNVGPRPGQKGSAVIAGHYGWENNAPAVFDHLSDLTIGDKIFVEDEEGGTTTFVVREMRTYDKDAIAPEVFRAGDGKAHLNLITCTGDWDNAEQTRTERLVIFADEEEEILGPRQQAFGPGQPVVDMQKQYQDS